MQQDGDDSGQQARDAERLRELEERLAKAGRDDRLAPPGMDKFAHANQAWRMVIELVAGLGVGFGIGYGLDLALGTTPVLMVLFIFLGFAAGIKTMLRTAAEMGGPPVQAKPGDDPAKDERD